MKARLLLFGVVLCSRLAAAQTLTCNLDAYKPVEGVRAEVKGGTVALSWNGEVGEQLMAEFALREGQPVVVQLAARSAGGPWTVLAKDLSPDFEVSTGKRRISTTQTGMMARVRVSLTTSP